VRILPHSIRLHHPETDSVTKRKRLSKVDVMDMAKERDIHLDTELLALAAERAEDGQNDLKGILT